MNKHSIINNILMYRAPAIPVDTASPLLNNEYYKRALLMNVVSTVITSLASAFTYINYIYILHK